MNTPGWRGTWRLVAGGVLMTKLRRDLLRLWSPVLSIALVVACAVATLVTTQSCVASLEVARDRFYREAHMADLFVSLRRAPRAAVERVASLAGVAQVQGTVERPARLLLPGVPEPVMGQLIGVPEPWQPGLNQVRLRTAAQVSSPQAGPGRERPDGCWPAWVSEGFAQARQLRVGDRLQALVNGHLRCVDVAALALSPEHVFVGLMGMPDPRGFGVLWVDEQALAAAWSLQGAVTRLAIRLAPGAREETVREALQPWLAAWGAREAVPQRLQASHQMLENEIAEQRLLGTLLPAIFGVVSVFLLHVVMTRLVSTQRESMACLNALGVPRVVVALHYGLLVLVMAALGWAVGVAAGRWAAQGLLDLYRDFFRFPSMPLITPAAALGLSAVVALLSALLGTSQAVASTLRLAPAEALQPPAPPRFRRAWWEGRSARRHRAGLMSRMIARQLWRRPWRSAAAVLGVASAMALVVMGNFVRDAIDTIVAHQFQVVMRADVQVMLTEPGPAQAGLALARLPGVIDVEGARAVQATLVNGAASQRVQLQGLEPDAALQRLIDLQGRVVMPREGSVVLTDRLARKLGLHVGDPVRVRLVDGKRPEVTLVVGGVMAETMGLRATTTRTTLNRLLGEGDAANLWALRVEPRRLDELLRATSGLPRVGGAFSKAHLLRNMQEVTARNVRWMSLIMTSFALVVAVGVVWNHARIALAERSWELASLRVLGFTRGECTRLLVGELLVLVLLAIPLGIALGHGLVLLLSLGLRSDQFQFPVVILPRTHAGAALAVLATAAASAVQLRRRVARLDMVSALKIRE